MHFQLTKPELEHFIADKVKAGDFSSPEAVVENALARMMHDELVLTVEDVAAIDVSDEQFDRGAYVDFDIFASEMRNKYRCI